MISEYLKNDPNYYQEYVDIILTHNMSYTSFYLGLGCHLFIRNTNNKLEQFGVGGVYGDENIKKEYEELNNFTNGYVHLRKVNNKIINYDEYMKEYCKN
jgi:hypothetical protein